MVRCRLDGPEEPNARLVRYVPLGEFGLWKNLMELRHGRQVTVDGVSQWVPEEAFLQEAEELPSDDLEPVLRVTFDCLAPGGPPVPVQRFFPVETYPEALDALLSHYLGVRKVVATPGYFVVVTRSTASV